MSLHLFAASHAPDRRPDDAGWPAYEALVRNYYSRLCACAARYVGAGPAAEDVVQDVLLRVWMHRHELGDVDLLGYLIQSVRNAAISMWRRNRADAARGERVAADLALRGTTPKADVAERDEIAQAVAAAIDALPERCRLIFLLHRDGELTYREIADRLDLSIKTVETQMGRALKSLRERLSPLLCASLCFLGDVTRRLVG